MYKNIKLFKEIALARPFESKHSWLSLNRDFICAGLLMLAVADVSAYDFKAGNLYYEITDARNLTVGVTYGDVKYTGSITIPQTATNPATGTTYRVRSIDGFAFNGCVDLTAVSFASVKEIGNNAFQSCTSLTSISLAGVEEVGSSAFSGCSALKSVAFGNTVTTLGNNVFQDCVLIENVSIPDCVTSIGESFFSGCSRLKTVVIGNELKEIPPSVFYRCQNLQKVTLGSKVKKIGAFAFCECTMLSDINFNDNIEEIGNNAFQRCTNLTNVVISANLIKMGGYAFSGCEKLQSVVFHEGCMEIGGSAFADCIRLNTVSIPNSVLSIGESAFSGCTSLTTASIGNGVYKISSQAFYGCTRLQSVKIGSGTWIVDNWAFYDCPQLRAITLLNPDVPDVGSNSFRYYNATLTVPSQSVAAYKSHDTWKLFNNIQAYATPVYLTIKQADGGSVRQTVKVGESVSYTVVPEEGWHIHAVTFNNTDVTRQLVGNVYTTPDITADAVLRVSCERNTNGMASTMTAYEQVHILSYGSEIVVQNTPAGEPVYVYNINGTLEGVYTTGNGETRIATKGDNVYIVKFAGKTVKVCM